MPRPPLPVPIVDLLTRPNPAVIATVRPDGQPVTVATWYLLEGDEIVVNMAATRKRLEYLRADPRVALTILDANSWYSHVSITGRVTALLDDSDFAGIDRQSLRYGGRPYPNHRDPRVDARIGIDTWHAWGEIAEQVRQGG
ncbi:MAG TPA: TIGR03618 family F420-dependent PPOX class oxidoreductase [Nakamurella sp.]